MILQFVSMLLLQAQHSPLRIDLNAIITLYIFCDSLLYSNMLEHFSLILDQVQCYNMPDVHFLA